MLTFGGLLNQANPRLETKMVPAAFHFGALVALGVGVVLWEG